MRKSISRAMSAPARLIEGKLPVAYYNARAADLRISYEDVVRCSVKIPDKKCTECDETAAHRNRGYCVTCAAYWIPKAGETGCALLGPEFMYSKDKPYNKTKCSCGSSLCNDIGWAGRGRFALPSGWEDGEVAERQAWFDMAGIVASASDEDNDLNTKKEFLAYWHFPDDRREYDGETETWKIKDRDKPHKPNPTKSFEHIVPSNSLRDFIDEVRAARRSELRDDAARNRRSLDSMSSSVGTPAGSNDTDLGRALAQAERADAAEEEVAALRRREQEVLDAAGYESMMDVVTQLKDLMAATGRTTIAGAVEALQAARDAGVSEEQAESSAAHPLLRYSACGDKDFEVFTYFSNREMNDAFLDVINAKRDDNDDGECSRLLRFSLAKSEERNGTGNTRKRKRGGGRKRKLHWKDEYLAWSCYVHCGWTEKQVARLFGVGQDAVSDIIRTWSVYMDKALALLFPNPTKAEVLRSYPLHLVRVFGHARIMMNLDASDVKGETARFSESQTASYSMYHSQTGAKLLVGCTPIAALPHSWIPDAYPSGVSDEAMTEATGIIRDNLRFGDMVNVDRGFCVENHAIDSGVTVSRPQKKMRGQDQFSQEDGHMHHKVGTTRIVIEQANSTAKQQSGYLQRTTPALQFDLLGTIARVSFLMTNFSAPLTTGVRVGSIAGRACRGGVQWMAQPEPETIDARKQPHLWCTKTQLELHQRLSLLLVGMPAEHVSELVLLELCLEKCASDSEKSAREDWLAWKKANESSLSESGAKNAELRSLAKKTLDAVDAARKAAGRLGVY